MQKPMSLWKNLIFHILPGAAITLIYLLFGSNITDLEIPKALVFYISGLFMIPVMYLIIKKNTGSHKVADAVEYRDKIPIVKLIALGILSFIWAAGIMVLTKSFNASIQNDLFGWMMSRFDFSDYLLKPDLYPRSMLILTWAVGLATTSTILPIVEEYYFRGFLLSKLQDYKLGSVFISAFFFSLYHIFSPWLLLTRFVAILPMTYFVYKYKNIKIGIIAHVLLNLVGDTISSIPIVFG